MSDGVMSQGRMKNTSKHIGKSLSMIALTMLIGMTLYEALKQALSPNITIWESHAVTIVLSTVIATSVGFYVLRRLVDVNGKLSRKNEESERLRKELQATVEELEASLGKIQKLSGMIPICASCKKIRTDEGYWSSIEQYISEHSEATFSHGVCPECAKLLYPELLKEE